MKTNHTDIMTHGWVGRMPRAVQPYLYLMRLDRPIGTWLLFLPALWAIALTGHSNAISIILLFAFGSLIMRGAGCVINDLWDRDLDGKVERTQSRPIPNGDITIREALCFLAFLLCVGFAILIQLNLLTICLGVLSLAFVVIYPLMKRWTWWPQAFLGLTFNFGALMGWSAVTGDLPWQAFLLYLSGIFWTLGYDTIYAMQDREDDALIGIKSTARLFVDRMSIDPRIPCAVFYILHISCIIGILISVHATPMSIATLIIPFCHLMWQAFSLSQTNPENALKRFKSNRDYGILLFLVILFLY